MEYLGEKTDNTLTTPHYNWSLDKQAKTSLRCIVNSFILKGLKNKQVTLMCLNVTTPEETQDISELTCTELGLTDSNSTIPLR